MTATTPTGVLSPTVALVAVVGVLIALVVARRVLDLGGAGAVVASLLATLACLLLARAGGADNVALGLDASQVPGGLRWGGAVMGAVALGLVLVALIPATRTVLEDDRVAVGVGGMLVTTLVVIPLGTVVLEEVAFRGALLALGRESWGTPVAVAVSSVLFGLWHIPPTLRTAGGNAVTGDIAGSGLGLALATAGMVVAMTAAGAVLCWLRLRSGSLLAPVLTHVATNSITFAVAWWVNRDTAAAAVPAGPPWA